ncbi:WD40-like Beta Propeller Repeat [Bradyrhizobium erythrophlei]|jgi:WD40-like Beta Propeller Repeat|nr:WD40-like Beta Propeller Repeat [Bradyrhizobium erythrophlei]
MPSPPPVIPLVDPVFILPPGGAYSDYRPVIDRDGQQVIFERTIAGSGTVLYWIANLSSPTPQPQPLFSATYPSSRADWSWITGQIAFNYGPEPTPTGIGIADIGDADPALLIGTGTMDYPVWFPGAAAQWLAVMNSQPVTLPVPRTSKMSVAGVVEPPTLSGDMWAGMPSVNQASELVFAGQLPGKGAYKQDNNCIWRTDVGGANLRPLEANYSGNDSGLPNFQGRAPWWSPDGQWVVFESNRPIPANGQPNGGNPDNQYAIYLYKADRTGGPAMQVTDPGYNMNHAKFFPAGFNGVPGDPQLIVSSWRGSPAVGPYALAKLSIGQFISG